MRRSIRAGRNGNIFADPEWTRSAASECDDPIVANVVNSFLRPTAFSSVQ